MNLESLQRHIKAVKEFEWRGHRVHLRKIGAKDGIALFATIRDLDGNPRTEDEDRRDTLCFNASVVSKSLANESGELLFDSDEGRETLQQVNFYELSELSDLALAHSGKDGQKKSLPDNSLTPIDSASNSDSGRTPTTSSPA
jgi:hypothetical protein